MICPLSQQLLITELKFKYKHGHLQLCIHCSAVLYGLYTVVYLSALSYEVLSSWMLGTRSPLSMSGPISKVPHSVCSAPLRQANTWMEEGWGKAAQEKDKPPQKPSTSISKTSMGQPSLRQPWDRCTPRGNVWLAQVTGRDDVEELSSRDHWLSLPCFTQFLYSLKFYTEHYTNSTQREGKRRSLLQMGLSSASPTGCKSLCHISHLKSMSVCSCGGSYPLNPYRHNASNPFPSICPQWESPSSSLLPLIFSEVNI